MIDKFLFLSSNCLSIQDIKQLIQSKSPKDNRNSNKAMQRAHSTAKINKQCKNKPCKIEDMPTGLSNISIPADCATEHLQKPIQIFTTIPITDNKRRTKSGSTSRKNEFSQCKRKVIFETKSKAAEVLNESDAAPSSLANEESLVSTPALRSQSSQVKIRATLKNQETSPLNEPNDINSCIQVEMPPKKLAILGFKASLPSSSAYSTLHSMKNCMKLISYLKAKHRISRKHERP